MIKNSSNSTQFKNFNKLPYDFKEVIRTINTKILWKDLKAQAIKMVKDGLEFL